jgi:hypothetical protein
MKRFLIALLMIGSACIPALSQDSPRSAPSERSNASPTHEISPNSTLPGADFIIGPEDALFITVWHEPEPHWQIGVAKARRLRETLPLRLEDRQFQQ